MARDKAEFDVLAHDKASDKLDRIAAGFRKLGRESDNLKKSDGLADLSRKLKRVADDAEKEGNRAGKGFGSGFKKWVGGDGRGLFKQIGENSGTVFGSGLLGALKTPILGPAILAAVGGVAATVMPAAGAIAGGALVAGFGAGLAGLGVAFAAKSEAVKQQWSKTMTQLGADMRLLARPFETTLVRMAGIFERTVDKFNPHLGRAFEKMAPTVLRFVDQTGRALEGLIPAIAPITDAFNAVLDTLGPALQTAIKDISSGLQDLARSVQANPDALADLVRGAGDLVRTGLNLVTTLNDVNSKFEQMTGGVSLVDVTMRGLQATLTPLIGLFAGLEKALDLVNAASSSADASGESMAAAAASTVKLAQGYQGAGAAAKGFVPPVTEAGAKTETLTQKFNRQKAATDALITNLFRLQQGFLTLSGAQISYQEALDNATASAKENGKTLDINTAKGRANRQALNEVARSANEQTEAMIRNGKGTSAAGLAAERSRANFVRIATQMGATVPQAKRMAAQMIAIPNVSREARLTANKKDLESKLAAAKRQLADPNLTKERRAKLNAEIGKLQAGIAAAKRALASVPSSKTVTITTRHVTERIVRNQTATGGGRAPGFAGGGLIPGSPSRVDNHWRPMATGEFVVAADKVAGNLPLLESINEGRRPASLASGSRSASSSSTVVLRVESGGSRMDDLIVELIRRYVRVNGGNVQAVLGQ